MVQEVQQELQVIEVNRKNLDYEKWLKMEKQATEKRSWKIALAKRKKRENILRMIGNFVYFAFQKGLGFTVCVASMFTYLAYIHDVFALFLGILGLYLMFSEKKLFSIRRFIRLLKRKDL